MVEKPFEECIFIYMTDTHLVLVVWTQFVPRLWVVLAIPAAGQNRNRLTEKATVGHRHAFFISSAYETSGFLRPRRARYSKDMVAPPPMKKKRGISCKKNRLKVKQEASLSLDAITETCRSSLF